MTRERSSIRDSVYLNYFIEPYLRGIDFYSTDNEIEIKNIQSQGVLFFKETLFYNGVIMFKLTENAILEIEDLVKENVSNFEMDVTFEQIEEDRKSTQGEVIETFRKFLENTDFSSKKMFAVNLRESKISTFIENGGGVFIPAFDLDIFEESLISDLAKDLLVENEDGKFISFESAIYLLKQSLSVLRQNVMISTECIVFKVKK